MTIKSTIFEKPIPIQSTPWNWQLSHEPKIIESHEPLINAAFYPERILINPAYFNQQIKATTPAIYIRKSAYLRLTHAARQLPNGYKFMLLDVWRSNRTQTQLFTLLKNQLSTQFPNLTESELLKRTLTTVAPPSTDTRFKPAPHNTGGAVDLTIVDELGIPLEFGTAFDDHTEIARTSYYEEKLADSELLEKEVGYLHNRRLLFNLMTSAGFTNYTDEWWHFDYGNQNWAWQSNAAHAIYGATEPNFVWNRPF